MISGFTDFETSHKHDLPYFYQCFLLIFLRDKFDIDLNVENVTAKILIIPPHEIRCKTPVTPTVVCCAWSAESK
jgi:hypothetical protein